MMNNSSVSQEPTNEISSLIKTMLPNNFKSYVALKKNYVIPEID